MNSYSTVFIIFMGFILLSDGYKLRKSDIDFDYDNTRDNRVENNFFNYLRNGKKEKSELNYKFNIGREGEDEDRAQQVLYVYQTNFIFKVDENARLGDNGCPLFPNVCMDYCRELGHKAGFCSGWLHQGRNCECKDSFQ